MWMDKLLLAIFPLTRNKKKSGQCFCLCPALKKASGLQGTGTFWQER